MILREHAVLLDLALVETPVLHVQTTRGYRRCQGRVRLGVAAVVFVLAGGVMLLRREQFGVVHNGVVFGVLVAHTQLDVRHLRPLAVFEDEARPNEAEQDSKRNEDQQISPCFFSYSFLANLESLQALSEGPVVVSFLIPECLNVLALGVQGTSESDSLTPRIEDCVVPVEEVQAKDPVADARRLHQPELALSS